jgi:hypothetical protein
MGEPSRGTDAGGNGWTLIDVAGLKCPESFKHCQCAKAEALACCPPGELGGCDMVEAFIYELGRKWLEEMMREAEIL